MLLLKKLKIILNYKYSFIILTVFILLYTVIITNFKIYHSKYQGNETIISGYIDKLNSDGDKLTITLIAKEKIIVNYYFKTNNDKNSFIASYHLGDKIKVTGELIKPKANTIPNLFNYRAYLYQNKIHYLFTATSINKIKSNQKINYLIKNYLITRMNQVKYSKHYLKAFILGDMADVDGDVVSSYQINGVSHLFAVSGMNVTLLASAINFLLKKLKINKIIQYLIIIIFLWLYMFITNYTASILRSSFFFIFLELNKLLNLKIKTIDILLFTFSILLLSNPYYLFNVGFEFSFIICFYLLLMQSRISKYKHFIVNLLLVSVIAFLASIPICIYHFSQINLLSVMLNLFLVPFVSLIMFPLSLIVFVFPFLDQIFFYLINILEVTSLYFAKITFLQIVLAKPGVIIILFYYLLITLTLYNYRYVISLIITIFIHTNIVYFNNNINIIMLDVGQGDAFLIELPRNQGNILIDTGGSMPYSKEKWQQRKSNYSLSEDSLIPYFKSIGINKIDYLILTHGDYDHMGEGINLVNNFTVNKVIFNKGAFNNLEQDLIKFLKRKKISFNQYQKGNILKIKQFKFFFISPNSDYDEENDNSLVIYTQLFNFKVLLMGDASIKDEEAIIKDYQLNQVDLLKIGHHGSITSSSASFLEAIKPKYSLISVGLNNKFNHPNKVIINRLTNFKSTILQTKDEGSILFKISPLTYTIKTYPT